MERSKEIPSSQSVSSRPPTELNPSYGPPAGLNPSYGPPAGLNPSYGPPAGQNPNYGPPAGQNSNYGAPGGQNPNYGAPAGLNPSYGPPAGQNPNYGAPAGLNPSYGPPAGQNPSYGPPAGQNLNYGAPGGQNPNYRAPGGQSPNYGPPAGQIPNYGPPAGQNPSYGPPAGQNPNYRAPGGQSPNYGAPAGQDPNYGAPGGQNPSYGPPAGQNQNYGALGGQSPNYGAPAGQDPHYGAPGGQNPNYGPPAGQNPNYGAPGGQNPNYGAPAGQNPNYGAPAGQSPNYGAPGGQNPNYGAPAGQSPNYGAPAGQNPNYGAPAGQSPNYGAPAGQSPNYEAPGGQNPGYRTPAGQSPDYGTPGGQNVGLGAPVEQNPGKEYTKSLTSSRSEMMSPHKDDVEKVSGMLHSQTISSNRLNCQDPELQSVKQGGKTPGTPTIIHTAHHEGGKETGADFQDSSSQKPEEVQQYLRHLVMVSNLSPESQEEDLINFLESVIDDDVEKIKYTEDYDIAVVIFKGDEDFQERAIKYRKRKKKDFVGQILELSPLMPSCCISVHGVGKNLVQDSLQKYFESPESGNDGGASVVDSLLKLDKDYAILTFEDPEVVEKVLMKTEHVLDGKTIRVREHYKETRSPTYDKTERTDKLTKVLGLELVEARLLMVLKYPESCVKKWKGFSAICDGQSSIVFEGSKRDIQSAVEELNDLKMTISRHTTCMQNLSDIQLSLLQKISITEHIFQLSSQKKVQGAWQCDEGRKTVTVKAMSGRDVQATREIINKSVMREKIEALSVDPDDMECLNQEVEKENPEYTPYFLLTRDYDSVVVCAPEKYISRLKKATERIVKEIEKKNRARKSTSMDAKQLIKDQKYSVPTLVYMNPLRAKFIHVNMHQDVNRLASRLGLTISLDPAGKGLIVRGPDSEHKEASGSLKDMANKLLVKELKEEGPHVMQLDRAKLIPVIAEYAEKTIRCVVNPVVESLNSDREEKWTTSTGLTVHVFQGAVANLSVQAVVILVHEDLKPMDRFAKTVQEKGGYEVKVAIANFQSKNGFMKHGQVHSTTAGEGPQYDKILHLCFKKDKKNEKQKHEALSSALRQCLHDAHRHSHASIAIPTFGPELDCGDPMTVSRIVTTALKNYFALNTESSIKDVYLLSRNEHFEAFTTNGKIYLPENSQTHRRTDRSQRVFTSGLQVSVVTGDLAEQKVDVVVNTVSTDLNLDSGAISKSLLKAGGPSLQTECRQNHPEGVAIGMFVSTKGTGDLHCKEVYHCCLPSKSCHEAGKMFKRLVKEMLDAASKSGYSTIALPSLGTGNIGFKHKDVASWMFEAVRLHKKTMPDTHLTGITMVIHHKDNKSLSAFTDMHEKYEGKIHGAAPDIPKAPERTYAAAAAAHSPLQHLKKGNAPKIELVEGEIADQKVDVIVNTASSNLDLSKGNVSRSILTKGGSTIQDEVTAKYGYTSYIPDGNFVVSRGGKLKCRVIYHSVLKSWGTYYNHAMTNEEFLASLVTKCLDEASRHGSQTIAFPALGTGMLGYPHEVVAKTMYDVVKNYGPTSLTTVLFVVYDKDTKSKEAFRKEHVRYKEELWYSPRPSHTVAEHTGKGVCPDAVTVKVGNILTENCDCIVVPVDPDFYFYSGSICKQLSNQDAWPVLLKTCQEQKSKMAKDGVLLVPSFKTCNANMVLFVNRDMVGTNQQFILSTSLAAADEGDNYQLAFPILVSGQRRENAVRFAKDLYQALEEFSKGSPQTLVDIRVIVSDKSTKEAFELEMNSLKDKQPRKMNQASGSKAFGQETLDTAAPSTTQPSHKQVCAGSHNSAHASSKARVTYQVASDEEMSISKALDVLQRLSVNSQNVMEEIQDDRLQGTEKETIGNLSEKFEIKVRVSNGKVTLTGRSFKVCQALKEVLQIISSPPKLNTVSNPDAGATTSRQNSESHPCSASGSGRGMPCVADNIMKSVHQDVRPKTNKDYVYYFPSNTNTPINDFGEDDENVKEGELFGAGGMSGNRETSIETEDRDSVDRTEAASGSFDEAGQEDDKVEWYFVDDTEEGKRLQSYDSMNSKIEAAYLKGDYSIVLQGQEEEQYVIHFDKMEEYLKGEEMDRVPVIRRQKVTDAYAAVPQKLQGIDPEGMKLVQLVRSSSEFLEVTEQFTSASQLPSSSVVKIEEILNVTLFKNYESKKAQMLTQGLKEDELNEKQLWHGPLVNTDVIVSVSNFGFNRNYCNYGEEDDLGRGVYFYTNIGPILKTSQPDRSGHHHVCLSKVLTGRACPGRSTLRDAPASCHSVADIDSTPSKFAIFFDNQALPLYLLTFTAEQK